MIFSTTEIESYMRCPQKWDITSFNRSGLEPVMKAPALALGTLIHKTIEDWSTAEHIDGLVGVDPVAIYDEHANKMFADVCEHYKQRTSVKLDGVATLGLLEAQKLGRTMIQNYQRYWGGPVQKGFRLIKAEQTVTVPIPGTEHCACLEHNKDGDYCACPGCIYNEGAKDVCGTRSSAGDYDGCVCVKPHYLESTLDGLMLHEETGKFYIRENKTFKKHPDLQTLQRNFQFLCYIWAAREFFGMDVVGIAYDGLWKRADIPRYKPTKGETIGAPRRKRDGTIYDESDLFLRTTCRRGPAELSTVPAMLAVQVARMADPNTPIFRIVPPVGGCKLDCKEHILLCDQIWRNEDTTLTLKHYQVRQRTRAYEKDAEDEDDE